MDIDKVILKFKPSPKGNQVIAYCDEYPQVSGIGPNEGQAVANFWRAFNKAEDKQGHQATMEKKAIAKAEVTTTDKKKKAA